MRSGWPFFAEESELSNFRTSDFKSSKRLERHERTTTAMLNLASACCCASFRSTVMKMSKFFSASARRLPFSKPAQPICGAVLTVCPTSSGPNLRGKHSSNRMFTSCCPLQDFFPGLFQKRDCLFSRNGWEIVEKLIERVARLEIIEQGLNRHPGPCETGCAAHYFRI